MIGHFQNLLEGMATDAESRISELPLMSEAERRQVLVEWNDTRRDFDEITPIHMFFQQQAARTPDRLAVVCNDRQITYAALDRRSNRLAHFLRRHGSRPETLVGVCMSRSIDMLVTLLGILKAGAAYVPLDPAYPQQRLDFILEDAQVALLVSDRDLDLPPLRPETTVIRLDAERQQIACESDASVDSGVSSSNLAYLIYTSGSTGRPKGVAIEHRSAAAFLKWAGEAFAASGCEVVLASTSICFDLSVFELFWPLSVGHKVALTKNVLELAESGVGEGIELINTVPSAMSELARSGEMPGSVRVVNLAGEALSKRLVEDLYELGHIKEVNNLYGPSEDTTYTTWGVMRTGVGERVTIGRPIANTRVYIVDENGGTAPVGAHGELWIGGMGLARGYLNRPELTAEKFAPEGLSGAGGERVYRTGDVGRYLSDGEIEYLGRKDEQVKIRGYRIEPGEVEVALTQHEAVQQAIVLARENRLIAYVVGQGDQNQLRASLQSRLPEYMVPNVFVMMESLPLTPNGKVDRKALPTPDSARPQQVAYVAPRNRLERALARIWAQLLRVNPIGVHDNFFELGGDSIMGIQMISRARAAGYRFTVKQLFQNQTIASLAAVPSADRELQAEQGLVVGPAPLAPIQQWFFEQEHADAHHFNQATALEIGEEVETGLLKRAIEVVVAHHDALRLRYVNQGGRWGQFSVAQERNEVFWEMDLSGQLASDLDSAIEEAVDRVQASLDLINGPIVRVGLINTGRQTGRLMVIAIHHLAVDAVSWRILLADIYRGYEQASRGKGIDLGAKTTSYKQWSELLREYTEGEEIIEQAAYWERQVSEKIGKMPVDYEGGENTVCMERSVLVELSEAETQALLKEAPRAYRTQINDLLLTAMALAYNDWSGSTKVRLAVEGHGREDIAEGIDLTRTVGWFTSIYPVALEVKEGGAIAEQIKRIKEQIRGIPNKGIGYGLLRYLSDREALRAGLSGEEPEISFNYFGQLGDGMPAGAKGIKLTGVNSGRTRSPKQRRRYLLDVNSAVEGGRLQMRWSFSQGAHRRDTIEWLAGRYMAALRRIIEHCVEEDGWGYTVSDFPLARLNQDKLEEIVGGRRDIEDIYPLTPLQKGLLFHSLYAPKAGEYVVQTRIEVKRAVEIEVVERIWQEIVDRHDILRSEVIWEGVEEPLHVVRKGIRAPIERRDLSGKSVEEQEAEIEKYLREDRARGFNLRDAAKMRVWLIKRGDRRWEIIWSHHHIALDGWSFAMVMKEAMGQEGRPRRPYRDYIQWLKWQDMGKAEEYWRERLKGIKEATRIGIERCNGKGEEIAEYAEEVAVLGEEATEALHRITRERKVTLNTVALGAWAVLLSRYSGETDVIFGETVSGRPAEMAGVEEMIGLFINTLPVRAQVRDEEVVGEWLKKLQQEQVEMAQYEYSSLVDVQEWSEVKRGRRLFESLYVFENYPVEKEIKEWGDQAGISRAQTIERTNYPLTVTVSPASRLVIAITYDRSLYEEAVIKRLAGHFEAVCRAIAVRPSARVRDLDYLSEAEKRELLVGFNDTQADFPKDKCLHQLFVEQAARCSEKVAVVCGYEQLTYQDLYARSRDLALYLQSEGVEPDTLVGLCMERSLEMVVSLLGILQAGGAYAPLDPDYPDERLAHMLLDSRAAIVLTQEKLLGKLAALVPADTRLVALDRQWSEIDDRVAGLKAENVQLRERVQPGHLAYVIYTSGSTGRPKGVMNEHRGVVNRLIWMQRAYGLDAEDAVLQKTPFSFDVSVWEFFWPLLVGARLVMARPEGHKDPGYLVDAIRRNRITTLHFVPPMLQIFLEHTEAAQSLSLTRVICSGEALPSMGVRRFAECLPHARLYNLYGPTEAAVDVTAWACPTEEIPAIIPIGRPIENTRIYILDASGALVPVGIAGELHIGGVQVARGYLNQPNLTAERFALDPFAAEAGARMYKTGDLARWRDDGTIEFLGRNDFQVKIRGFRIELGEVEMALTQHEAVKQAIVLAREDATGEKRLVGYVVMEGEWREQRVSELRSYLMERLPEYMAPSAWVVLDELPYTPNGKIDRRALPEPDNFGPQSGCGPREPRDVVELRLLEIWENAFNVSPIGITDSFFDLGGHSLLAIRISSDINKEFNIDLPLNIFLREASVERLARMIRKEVGGARESIVVPIQPRGSRPAFFCVHPGGGQVFLYAALARHLGSDQPFYGLQDPVLYEGGDPDISMEERASRYVEALREIQPQGPYFLGGWSFGGHVAFQMAQCLKSQGEDVALLLLLDTATPSRSIEPDDETRRMAIILSELFLLHHGSALPSLQELTDYLRQLEPEGQLKYVRAKLREHSIPELRKFPVKFYMKLLATRQQVLRRYTPKVYPGQITIIFSGEEAISQDLEEYPEREVNSTLGWDELSTEPVEIYYTPGDHNTMCLEPHVQTLAARLRFCLDKSQK